MKKNKHTRALARAREKNRGKKKRRLNTCTYDQLMIADRGNNKSRIVMKNHQAKSFPRASRDFTLYVNHTYNSKDM